MLKRIGIAAMAAALATLGLIGPAQAGTSGTSCNLSAHWPVNSSAKWVNVSGHVGELQYVALSSPGQIDTQYTIADVFNSSGNSIGGNHHFASTGFSGGLYHYRTLPTDVDLDIVQVHHVIIVIQIPSGLASCRMTLNPA